MYSLFNKSDPSLLEANSSGPLALDILYLYDFFTHKSIVFYNENIIFSSDFIIGYPGESNQDFRASDLSGPVVAAVLIADCSELRIEVASILFQKDKQNYMVQLELNLNAKKNYSESYCK